MPELVPKNYDPNSGEWFPYPYDGPESDDANTRTRAMYFFHNSLGQVIANQSITFTDEITTAGSGSGSGWTGKQSDVKTWPITDDDDGGIETYSDGSACYRYRLRKGTGGDPPGIASMNTRFHIHHPPGWNLELGTAENQTGVSGDDLEIYLRYFNALEFLFDGNNTESIQWGSEREDTEEFFEAEIKIPLTYTDSAGVEHICDGTCDQTAIGQANNVTYFSGPNNSGQDPNTIGAAAIEAELNNPGGSVWNFSGSAWQYDKNDSVGTFHFNPVFKDTGGSPETQTGQFIVGDVVENYVAGDYLLLESPTNDDHLFHERVVFVTGKFEIETSLSGFAISVETLDDQDFEEDNEGEGPTNFTITKLTNAPKLKVKYRMTENTGSSIVITDAEEDVS